MPERQDPVFDTPAGAPAAAPAAPKHRPRRRRLGWLGLALLLVLATGLASLWWWSGREQSLAQTLAVAQRWLPAGMQLEVENAQGSLRFGGEIDRLRVSNQRFTLQIKNLTLAWNLGQLLQRRLAVERLHAARVDYRAQPEAPPDDTSSQPLRSLQLPLAIDLPVQIDTFTWADGPSAQLEHLAATYRYDRDQHRLQLSSLRYGPQQAQLSASVQLGGQAPLQLTAQAQASATPALALAQPLALQAQVDISGQLFGPQAQLQVTAQVQPQATDADAPTTGANSALPPLSARLHATVTPWQAQPLPQAQLELQHVNLALFAPQLPPSDLTGQLHITTDADGVWRFRTDIANPQAGPWDAPALPLQQLQAQAQFDGQVWTLDQLQLQLPHGQKESKGSKKGKGTKETTQEDPGTPGGQLQAQGQWTVATQALNAQVQLQGINPAHVLTSLPSQRISGSASAEMLAPADTPPIPPIPPIPPLPVQPSTFAWPSPTRKPPPPAWPMPAPKAAGPLAC